MLGRCLPRGLGAGRRIQSTTDDESRRTIDGATALRENTGLRRAAQLRLLRRLGSAGVPLSDVRTMIGRSTTTPEINSGLTRRNLIFKLLRPKEHHADSSAPCSETCCICQGDYEGGEEVASLRCGHEFHAACIAGWLAHRNLCPVCKNTAISLV